MYFHRPLSPIEYLAVAMAALSLVALPAGCSPLATPPEPVTLTFAYPNVDNAFYERLADAFHDENPYITIDLSPQSWDVFGGINPQDADVFATSQFALGDLLGGNRILDLTPFIEEDTQFDSADFYPGTTGIYSRDSKVWAVPSGLDLLVMYYSKDLFDTYGVAYPEMGWTWDDFLSSALALSDPTAGIFGYGPDYDVFDPMLFVYQGGGRVLDDLQNPTRTTFDEPETIQALEWYFNLVQGYNVAPTPEQARELLGAGGGGSVPTGIILNKIGMWTGMLSERGGTINPPEWAMRWGVVTLPRDEAAATLAVVEGYFISAQAASPDACWQWISFLSRQTSQRQIPARRSLLESSDYRELVGSDIATVAAASMENVVMLSPRLAEFQQAFAILGRSFDAILNGRATVEEAMVQAQQTSPFK